jgi:hypothetical protein
MSALHVERCTESADNEIRCNILLEDMSETQEIEKNKGQQTNAVMTAMGKAAVNARMRKTYATWATHESSALCARLSYKPARRSMREVRRYPAVRSDRIGLGTAF